MDQTKTEPPAQTELPQTESRSLERERGKLDEPSKPARKISGSKVHRLSWGGHLYTPPDKSERKNLPLLTVEQYLRKAEQDKSISDLIRSLHKTKLMSFAEWERESAALLKKKTW